MAGEPAVAKELVTIDQRFGAVERTGRWVVPQRTRIKATVGSAEVTSKPGSRDGRSGSGYAASRRRTSR